VRMLDQECSVFCRYLVRQEPNSYTMKKFQEAHKVGSINPPSDTFNRLLLRLAGTNPFWTKLVDTYTVVFCKSSVVRKKLILVLAILESNADTCVRLDAVDESRKLLLLIKIMGKGCTFVLVLSLSMLILFPIHIFSRMSSRLAHP